MGILSLCVLCSTVMTRSKRVKQRMAKVLCAHYTSVQGCIHSVLLPDKVRTQLATFWCHHQQTHRLTNKPTDRHTDLRFASFSSFYVLWWLFSLPSGRINATFCVKILCTPFDWSTKKKSKRGHSYQLSHTHRIRSQLRNGINEKANCTQRKEIAQRAK